MPQENTFFVQSTQTRLFCKSFGTRMPLLFMIALSSLLFSQEEENDEFLNSKTIFYQGLSFDCNYGCGDPDFDDNAAMIQWLCCQWLLNPIHPSTELSIKEAPLIRNFQLSSWTGDRLCCPNLRYAFDWNDLDNYERFLQTASEFFEALKDVRKTCLKNIKINRQHLSQIKTLQADGARFIEFNGDDENEIEGYQYQNWDRFTVADAIKITEKSLDYKQKELQQCERYQGYVEDTFAEIKSLYRAIFMNCLEKHQPEGIAFHNALEHFLAEDYYGAIKDINLLISLAEKNSSKNTLIAKLYLLKGQVQSESCLYSDAIVALTEAIEKNPNQKEAFFERAVSYFELGDFDRSLEDYLSSNIRPGSTDVTSILTRSFALGLSKGVLTGGAQATKEFIPSMLASLQGIGHGLWAFAQDPIEVSSDLVQAARNCVEFIKQNTPKKMMASIVPEFAELLKSWHKIEEKEKGEMVGLLIGKYGVELFAGTGFVKGIRLYRELKQANHLLTFETMAINRRNQEIIKAVAAEKASARKTLLKTNLTIKPDAQGKHLIGHKNYEPWRNRSITEHPDLQSLVHKFAGTGIKEGLVRPGMPGYQEIIDFREFIGYAVNRTTGEKITTTWGKIHYAKDGVHVVPRKPQGYP